MAATGVAIELLSAAADGQGVAAPELKAAFLLNFAKFAVWPDEALAADAPLNVCVVGQPAIADALWRLTEGQTIGRRELKVLAIGADAPLRACHVLYVENLDTRRTARLIESVKGVPILTVGHSPGFAVAGGIAEFFVDGGKMRFAVNVEAAQRARVQLSSRLLGLAKIVRDDRVQ
jgi:hypothetical protein